MPFLITFDTDSGSKRLSTFLNTWFKQKYLFHFWNNICLLSSKQKVNKINIFRTDNTSAKHSTLFPTLGSGRPLSSSSPASSAATSPPLQAAVSTSAPPPSSRCFSGTFQPRMSFYASQAQTRSSKDLPAILLKMLSLKKARLVCLYFIGLPPTSKTISLCFSQFFLF